MPRASPIDAMVLAVNMPAQEPSVGQALHSMALRADGNVLSWVYNNSGETNVPADLSNVVAIAAGGMHSLAVKADATVNDAIDAAYRTKYHRYGARYVDPMVAPAARAATIKLVPRATTKCLIVPKRSAPCRSEC